jgi:hypothetical protein
MEGVWSTQVKMDFVFLLSCEVFGQHKLRYMLSPRFKGGVLSSEYEAHFVNSLALEGFSQHKLR